jgi:hypothetical protein
MPTCIWRLVTNCRGWPSVATRGGMEKNGWPQRATPTVRDEFRNSCHVRYVATARQRALVRAQPRMLATTSAHLSDHFHIVIWRGSMADMDQRHSQTRVGMTVAISPPIRSIAVIGRKRSAQDSWDDACASTSFGRSPLPEATARDRPNL